MPRNGKNLIAFFSSLYYNQLCKKNLPFKNFFYITPYLIIYTPLERPDSSPIGSFTVYNLMYTGMENHDTIEYYQMKIKRNSRLPADYRTAVCGWRRKEKTE